MPKMTLFYAQSDPVVTLNDLCPKWLKIYALSDPPANNGTPYGKRDPYYSHTTPIRIPKDMGMVRVPLTIRGSLESPLTLCLTVSRRPV